MKSRRSPAKCLDSRIVEDISSTLDAEEASQPMQRLIANRGVAFKGSMIAGEGFVISDAIATDLLETIRERLLAF